MKPVVIMWVALASVAGVFAGQTPPRAVALGERFELRIGESAQFDVEKLQIGVDDILADSRCPKGERCIREGDATVRVWLQRASEGKQTLDLLTTSTEEDTPGVSGYQVRLLRLDPYPVSGGQILKKDYVATLVVTRGSSGIQ